MTQPSGNIIYSVTELGMPEDLPIARGGFRNIHEELRLLCQAPRSFNLPLDDGTIAVYDRIDETAGKTGEIVGRGLVTYSQNVLVPELVECGDLKTPGLVLYEHAVPAGQQEEEPAPHKVKRLLSYLAFKKVGKDAEFNGSVQVIRPQEVLLEVACMLKGSGSHELDLEMVQFAEKIGLVSLWTHFSRLENTARTHISVPVGRRMGRNITAAAKAIRLNLQV